MLKRNRGLILKTFLYQIVMSFFGLMMFSATSQNQMLLYVGQTLVILFFFYILFSQSSQYGSKSAERDLREKSSSSVFAGFLLALLGFLPAILLSVISFLNPPYAADGTGRAVVPFLINKTFLQGMYIGFAQFLHPTTTVGAEAIVAAQNAASLNSQTRLFLFTSLPGILLSGTGYLFGYFRFAGKKKTPKKDKEQ